MDSVKDKRWPQTPKAASYPGVTEGVHVQGLVTMIASLMAILVPRTRLWPALTAICPAADSRPVVSTCFPHAIELLGGGAGLLVGRRDPAGIAHALRRVLTEPGLSARMSRCAADLAPHLLWPAVARSYRELASSLAAERAGART